MKLIVRISKIVFIQDHHLPLNEQQQNLESNDEHEPSLDVQHERPLTPTNRDRYDTNVWVIVRRPNKLSLKRFHFSKHLH
jgi:hypothetical protein